MIKKLEKQKMAVGIVGQKIIFFGDNETGKTQVAIELGKKICKMVSSNPDAAPVVMSFENGTNAAGDFYFVDGTSYQKAKELLADLNNSSNKKYILDNMPVVIVDGAEKIPVIAKNYVTSKKDIEVLGDLSYGKGFDIFKSYTDAPFIKLMALEGITIIFIFHEEGIGENKDYFIPSGTAKENGVCKYIKDNSDYAFYLSCPIENGVKVHSHAYCDNTATHFGRNRYGEGAETFEIEFNADSVIDYIEACSTNLAKKKGADYITVVEKQNENSKKLTHGELVDEINRIGKILAGTSSKERTLEIISQYTEGTENGKISEVNDDNKLEYLLSDLTDLASDKGINID